MLNALRRIKHKVKHQTTSIIRAYGERAVLTASNGTVLDGVFSGIRLSNKDVFGSRIPKLLGCYEKELHHVIQASIDRQPCLVLNVGAAEGYFTIGYAKAGVKKVIAFEILTKGRQLIRHNAILNGVSERVHIEGECTQHLLNDYLSSNNVDLILMDIEGGELDLLSDNIVQKLTRTEILIESHDFCQPNCLQILKKKFSATHNLTVIKSTARHKEDFKPKLFLSNSMRLNLMDEHRPGVMSWLVCLPKPAGATV